MGSRKKIFENSMFQRLVVFVALSMLLLFLLFLRLFQIQIVNRNKYIEQAKRQYLYEAELKSQRGIIYDRNMEPLAVSRNAISVGVDVTKVINPDSVAEILSQYLAENQQSIKAKFKRVNSFVWVKRRIDDRAASFLDTLTIPGVRKIKESIRFYPRNNLAAHLVGFTDIDQKGLSGIELSQDENLTGNNGLALYKRDAYGFKMIDVEHPVKRPQKGQDVVLTINNTFQWIVEDELKYAIKKYQADAAVVIVADPRNGEILSLGVSPDYDLNQAGEYPADWRRNRAITDVYEPGSTFKSIIMAAILEEGLMKPDDIVFCENGRYQIYDREVKDATPYQWLSLQKVLKKSSNIGMAKITKDLDKRIVYKYLRAFGFGLESGIDLPGEASGEYKHYIEWSQYSTIAMSIGYEISVSPVQMVMAYAAIANGGLLLKPKIILTEQERQRGGAKPEIIRRVIAPTTAKTLTGMLEEVVYDGTGKRAFINGLRIAGKTGTAMKYDPAKKSYSEDSFVSSFIGFFPAEAPQYLIYVMIDNPRIDHLGGKVAAPTFKRILQRILKYVDIQPEFNRQLVEGSVRQFPVVPDLTNKRIDVARAIARHLGFELLIEDEGDFVLSQKLVVESGQPTKQKLILKLGRINSSTAAYVAVPDIVGMDLRSAVSKLAQYQLRAYIHGSGRVIAQNPKPGTKMRAGARCVIECNPVTEVSGI